jgi:hypothetical protein
MNLEELARRVTRLEDIDAIKELKARYCSICDDDHNPDRITTIFSDDGSGKAAASATPEVTPKFASCSSGFRSRSASRSTW